MTGLRSVPVPALDTPILGVPDVEKTERHRMPVAEEDVGSVDRVPADVLNEARVTVIKKKITGQDVVYRIAADAHSPSRGVHDLDDVAWQIDVAAVNPPGRGR